VKMIVLLFLKSCHDFKQKTSEPAVHYK